MSHVLVKTIVTSETPEILDQKVKRGKIATETSTCVKPFLYKIIHFTD